MEDRLEKILARAGDAILAAASLEELAEIRVGYLGRKQGELTDLMKELARLSPEERPAAGRVINQAKRRLEELLDTRQQELAGAAETAAADRDALDATRPGPAPAVGIPHPISWTMRRVVEVFRDLGFRTADGPEIETDFHNFQALNVPRHHPARDMQDTFYFSDDLLLRTHTSPVQVHVMLSQPPPVRIVCPGRVYRRDADVTHSPVFHQVEGLMVDREVSLGDLKGVLEYFVRRLFGPQFKVRFRPSFFPFTEPSAEVDISCMMCRGRGCRTCKQTGWIEILGCGMVDPAVFKAVRYDPEEFSGFAFGMGVERIAMLLFGVDDIRHFFESDRRFLEQFAALA